MNTNKQAQPSTLWSLAVGIAMVSMFSLAMAAQVHGARVAQIEGAQMAQSAPAARTASERAWNDAEDLKAGGFVGQPGIY